MRMGLARLLLITGVAAGCTFACGGPAPGEPPTPSTTQAPVASAPTGIACPNSHGGSCLGQIAAGTYTTTTFQPAITYTVPDGWFNGEDLPGNFGLQLAGDPRYLAIYRDVAAPVGCEDHPDPKVDRSVTAYSEWLIAHPGLTTTPPQPLWIGGRPGVVLDIGLDESWTTPCPWSEEEPVVAFIIGGGLSSLHHAVYPGFSERLYLLELDGGTLAIEIGPEGGDLETYLRDVQPIINSLRFG